MTLGLRVLLLLKTQPGLFCNCKPSWPAGAAFQMDA